MKLLEKIQMMSWEWNKAAGGALLFLVKLDPESQGMYWVFLVLMKMKGLQEIFVTFSEFTEEFVQIDGEKLF